MDEIKARTERLLESHVDSRIIHDGRFLRHRLDDITLPNGGSAKREVIEHPGGVVIMPVLDDGRFILVWQYRYAIGQVLLEFPAGKLERGESPLACAKRELEEETGYAATQWDDLHHIHTAPGFTDERLYLFRASGLQALASPSTEEDEFVELAIYDEAQLMELYKAGYLTDAKTASALYYHRILSGL